MREAVAGLVCLSAALGAPAPAPAAVNPPVFKWHRGGCFDASQGSYCQTGWYSSPAVADLDNDGQPDVIWGSYDVVALNGASGSLKWRGANAQRVWPGVAVADLTGDGTLEVVVGRGGDQLSVYSNTGVLLWTRSPFGGGEVRTLAVDDLDDDGPLEIIVGRASGGATQQLSVYDAAGNVRAGWPARRDGEPGYGWGMYNENLVVVDLDGNGTKEVYGPTDTHYVTALDRFGNQLPTSAIYNGFNPQGPKVWSQVGLHVDQAADLNGYADCGLEHRPNFADAAPAAADLDGDGSRELVILGDVYDCSIGDPDGDLYVLPWILRMDRTRWAASGFDWTVIPAAAPGSGKLIQGQYDVIQDNVHNTVIADLDGDGRKEILYPSYDGRIHAYWLDKTQHGSWPYDVPGAGFRFASEPAVADLDNDGQAEVIFTSWGEIPGATLGQLHIVSSMGVPLQAVTLPASFPAGEWNGGLGAPTIANIDADADMEVVLGTSQSGVVAYDLPGTAQARVLWGTGRGSYRRTGVSPVVPPSISIGDAVVAEGTGGATTAMLAVAVSPASATPLAIPYATAAGTAGAADFTAAAGTLTVPALATSAAIAVSIAPDAIDEPDETLFVNLTAPPGAVLADATGQVTITDDDGPSLLSVGDCTVAEAAGPCSLSVTVDRPSGFVITVAYATSNVTASAGSDYTATSGTLTFVSGATAQSIPVPITADAVDEPHETAALALSSHVNASPLDSIASLLILDDDGPAVSVGDVTVVEGSSGSTPAALAVSLASPAAALTTVPYATADFTASAPEDYGAVSGTLTFVVGESLKTVTPMVVADALDEPTERFRLTVGQASNPVADGEGLATITDDDGALADAVFELVHGLSFSRTLEAVGGVPARHWYALAQGPWSSYEIVADGVSGDLLPLALERRLAGGTSVPSVAGGTGASRALRWFNATSAPVADEHVTVASGVAGCTSACGADDVYRIRAYDTTLVVPRFNNAGTQITVLVVQNSRPEAATGHAAFWSPAGALLASQPFTLLPHAALVLNTASVPGLAGQSGTVTVIHDAGYGGLTGKTVALEPATGFSFDSPMVLRPR